MSKNIAYIRVSADHQDFRSQKFKILNYCNKQGLKIDRLEIERDELITSLKPKDRLIVSEFSQLDQSTEEVIQLIKDFNKRKVKFISIKQNLYINSQNKKEVALTTGNHYAFVDGCIDSIPICVSFAFLFFSIGSLCNNHGYSLPHTASMTFFIFSAPLQIFIAQNGDSISLAALIIASLLINFRFLIMSAALSEKFKSISLIKLFLAVPMLSASTFSASNKKGDGTTLFHYYVGIGLMAMITAILASMLGSILAIKISAFVTSIILPMHFAALTGLLWPKLKPILITVFSFFAAPIAGSCFGKLQVIIMPLLMATLFLFWEELNGKESK